LSDMLQLSEKLHNRKISELKHIGQKLSLTSLCEIV